MKKADIFEFYRRLAEANPAPETELEYVNPYTLLVAVALSAQATDVGVNKATRALFAKVTTPQQMLELGEEGAEAAHQDHRPVQHQGEERHRRCARSWSTNSAARCRATARSWKRCRASAARPPMSCSTSPSASRPSRSTRTSSGSSNRTGLAPGKNPLEVELKLEKVDAASRSVTHAHHWLILHGRYICKARTPECWRCPVVDLCAYKPKTPAPKAQVQRRSKPLAEAGQQLILRQARRVRRGRQVIIERHPIAFRELRTRR